MGRSATAHWTPASVPAASVPQSSHPSSGTGISAVLAAPAGVVPVPSSRAKTAPVTAQRDLVDQDTAVSPNWRHRAFRTPPRGGAADLTPAGAGRQRSRPL